MKAGLGHGSLHDKRMGGGRSLQPDCTHDLQFKVRETRSALSHQVYPIEEKCRAASSKSPSCSPVVTQNATRNDRPSVAFRLVRCSIYKCSHSHVRVSVSHKDKKLKCLFLADRRSSCNCKALSTIQQDSSFKSVSHSQLTSGHITGHFGFRRFNLSFSSSRFPRCTLRDTHSHQPHSQTSD